MTTPPRQSHGRQSLTCLRMVIVSEKYRTVSRGGVLSPPEQHGVCIVSMWDRDGLQFMPHPHSDQWIRPPYMAKCGSSGSVQFFCCRNGPRSHCPPATRGNKKKMTWRGGVYASIVRNLGMSYVSTLHASLSPLVSLSLPLHSGAEPSSCRAVFWSRNRH